MAISSSVVRTRHSKLYTYYSTMGYLFQIVRDMDPKLRIVMDTLTLIGLLWTGRLAYGLVWSTLTGVRTHVWSRLVQVDLKRKYGAWAVVTGCTDGLGHEYARQLATRGLNLVLIGRNPDKLDHVREELSQKHGSGIELLTVLADLNSDDPHLYSRVLAEIDPEERDIGILVNNAGVMYDSPNRLLDQPESKLWQQVRVNMLAVVMMTRIVLPSMVKKKRGLLVNMSSIAGYQPLTLMGLYSATKVFVQWFSESVDIEYREYGIEVQTLTPNYIATKMTSFSSLLQKASLAFPDAATFTANAIATIGRSKHTSGYWFHDLQQFATEMMIPNWAYRSMSWYFLKNIDTSSVGKDL